jgi:RNA polymerase sigma-70 factor (ECF subfamily)
MALTTEKANRAKLLTPAAFYSDDDAFVESFRAGNRGAKTELYRRYAHDIERVLYRVLGWDADIPDLVQEVFLRAIAGARGFRGNFSELKPWLTRIAVYTARGWIRKRSIRKWLRTKPPEEIPDTPALVASPEEVETLQRAYVVIEKLPIKERIPFTLRFIGEMDLIEVADACEVSLATIKRRLEKARRRFSQLASRDPYLNEYLTSCKVEQQETVV